MKLNAQTTLCCVIGNPIDHSLSPAMHNAGYKAKDLNYVYLAFRVGNVLDAIKGIRALGIKGVSVTVPHKIAVMQYVDRLGDRAKQIGAVNTILNENGKLVGSNTDCDGAIKALEGNIALSGKKVVLVGSGGAARAIAFGLKEKNADVLIVNRTLAKAKELAKATGARFGDLSMLDEIKTSDVLINATSVGLSNNGNDRLVPEEMLHKNLTVFDIVYNPQETNLIVDAKEAGCKIIYGYKMLLYQAVTQFELFTGSTAPVSVMEEALLKGLRG